MKAPEFCDLLKGWLACGVLGDSGTGKDFPYSGVGEFWKNQKCPPRRISRVYCVLLYTSDREMIERIKLGRC